MDYIDDDDMQNLLGLKLGIEKTIGNNLISGFTFSQRGYKVDNGLSDLEMNVNYLTGYLLKPSRISSNFDYFVTLLNWKQYKSFKDGEFHYSKVPVKIIYNEPMEVGDSSVSQWVVIKFKEN